MCLLIYKPAASKLPFELFENAVLRNKDGFGIMYHENNTKEIKIFKTENSNVKDHWNAYKDHRDKDIVLHWRHRTEGSISLENTHPFEIIKDKLYMMHNGSISNQFKYNDPNDSKTPSDTKIFIESFLKPLSENSVDLIHLLENSPQFRVMLEATIGNYNKLIFITPSKIIPINSFEKTDDKYIPEIRGIYFSNTYAWDNQKWFVKSNRNNSDIYTNSIQYRNRSHQKFPVKDQKSLLVKTPCNISVRNQHVVKNSLNQMKDVNIIRSCFSA